MFSELLLRVMPVPLKHRVIETDTQLVIEQEDTIHVHSEDAAVSVDRDWGISDMMHKLE